MKEKSVSELKAMMDGGEDFQLIDVREPHEAEICQIGGILIPMNTIPDHIDEIAKDKPVVIHCRSGARSGRIVEYLESQGFDNLYNLKGGILAWADEIDPEMAKY
ncbi:MAG: rhodanese-like domain-containing protein [Bacteroidetes bacterium]|nr:rhodanese-like domain-containing protein [Bacteroidota bacterium]MBS1617131.1 rhodanese-like domain-containing protein [Bacteroidota bacterium]